MALAIDMPKRPRPSRMTQAERTTRRSMRLMSLPATGSVSIMAILRIEK